MNRRNVEDALAYCRIYKPGEVCGLHRMHEVRRRCVPCLPLEDFRQAAVGYDMPDVYPGSVDQIDLIFGVRLFAVSALETN